MLQKLDEIKRIFEDDEVVKLAYFFGSRARGDAGLMSDWDFAVYLGEKDAVAAFDKKADLEAKLTRIIGQNTVDLVVLDSTKQPELKYNIVTEGRLLFEEEPYKLLVEPRIMNEYFDFRDSLVRNGLIKPDDK